MTTEIQKNHDRSLFRFATPEIKIPFPHPLTKYIIPPLPQPIKDLKNSVHYLTASIGTSLLRVSMRCFDIAKETLLWKADAFSQWVYQELKDIPSLRAKTPFEIDYAHDKTFWHAHFFSTIDDISSSPDPERLKNLQNLIWSGFLSPFLYEEGLSKLEWPPAKVELARQQFHTLLKNCPVVIEKGLCEDLRMFLLSRDLKDILNYYRTLMNPLDYKNILSAARTFLQKNKKELAWWYHTYQNTLAALNAAIASSDAETRKHLKRKRAFFNQCAQELPFYSIEINTQGVWADVKENTPLRMDLLSLSAVLKNAAKKSIRYVIAHPLQATTTILATQVAAAAALRPFAKQSGEKKGGVKRVHPELQAHTSEDIFSINQEVGNTNNPSMGVLKNGNVFVAWVYSPSEFIEAVHGRIFTPNGTAITDEFPIIQNETVYFGFSLNPITVLSQGNIFATLSDSGADTSIYGVLIAPNGNLLTDKFLLNPNTTFTYGISTAALNNGNVFITLNTENAKASEISGKIITSDGTTLIDGFPITQNMTQFSQAAIAQTLNNGNVFVAWENTPTGANYEIYGRVITSEGAAATDAFLINQNLVPDHESPQVALLNSETVFTAWTGFSDVMNVYGRIIAVNGTALTDEFRINQNTEGGGPRLAVLNDGNIFVAWWDDQTGNYNIRARVTTPNGTLMSEEFVIAVGNNLGPMSVAALNNGNVFVIWHDPANIIYGRVFFKDFLDSLNMTLVPPYISTTTGTTGTTGILPTTGTTGTTAHRTTTTTENPFSPSSPQPPDNTLVILIAAGAGVGGLTLIVCSSVLARKYYLSKHSRHSDPDGKPLLGKLELGSSSTNPFGPSDRGFTTRPTVVGTLNKMTFALRKQISAQEASTLEKILYRKIPFTPDSSDLMPFCLGKGQFGETFLASRTATKEWVAVKKIQGARQIKESLQEGQLQNRLKGSPHIMPILDYLHFTPSSEEVGQEPYLFQFMPLATINGIGYKALASSLANRDPALHQRLLTMHTYQLLKGLNFMHDQWIYHADIKDANILFTPDFTLKIADFGRALELGRRGLVEGEQALGDRRKFAPEQLAYVRHLWKKEEINTGTGEVVPSYAAGPADLWSGALFILETLAGHEPFHESIASFTTKVTEWTNESFQKVIDQERALQNASGSNLTGVIKKLLHADPQKRLEGPQAVKWHVFKTVKPLQDDEASALLKNLMTNLTSLKTPSSPSFDPYAAIVQQEKEAYYKYRLKG